MGKCCPCQDPESDFVGLAIENLQNPSNHYRVTLNTMGYSFFLYNIFRIRLRATPKFVLKYSGLYAYFSFLGAQSKI